jgi:hypothetical protein
MLGRVVLIVDHYERIMKISNKEEENRGLHHTERTTVGVQDTEK